MRAEVMKHYGLTTPLNRAGYFETAQHDLNGHTLTGLKRA